MNGIIVGNVTTSRGVNGSTSHSHNHNPTDDGGDYTDILLVSVASDQKNASITAKYNNVPMTLITGLGDSFTGYAGLFYMNKPPVGSHTIQVIGESYPYNIETCALTLSKCKKTGSIGNFAQNSEMDNANNTLNITTSADLSLLIDILNGNSNPISGSGGIVRMELYGSMCSTVEKTPAGIQSMGYGGMSIYTDSRLAAVEILAAQVSAPVLATLSGLTYEALRSDRLLGISASITSNGNEVITEYGFVWDTSINPTVTDNKVVCTGTFQADITGLLPGTTYYIRPYATNVNGTTYGSEFSFTTRRAKRPDIIQFDSITNYS